MFQIVYKRLGIHPDLTVQGESFYNPLIPATLQDLASKNMITTEDGAKLVWVKSNKKKKAKKKRRASESDDEEVAPGGKTKKARVSFGKNHAKEYKDSVKALKASDPSPTKLRRGTRGVLKTYYRN